MGGNEMSEYNICNDYMEILAGTTNKYSLMYEKVSKNISEDNNESLKYLKNFITSIESLSSKEKVKDSRISETKGNIESFGGYECIKVVTECLKKNLSGVPLMKDLSTLHDTLLKYKALYMDGYRKNIRLVVLEYDSILYMLVTGLSETMMNYIDVVQNGTSIRIQKKSPGKTYGVIDKTIKELASEVSKKSHKEYLEEMIKGIDNVGVDINVNESTTFMESKVLDTINLISSIMTNVGKVGKFVKRTAISIKNSVFGIVPLIRSILYIRYKRKADTILSLEQQALLLQRNIDQLQNMKNMDPKKKEEIIKKQKAYVEAYKKKAEKLRAQLCETEKDAAIEINKDNPNMKNTDGNDDLVLENGMTINQIFSDKEGKSESPLN